MVEPIMNHDGDEYEYDAFVSYSKEDRPWVEEYLLTGLEGRGKIIFDPGKDIPVGEVKSKGIEQAVRESRHMIAVISPAWLKNEWKAFEHQLVEMHDLDMSRRKLLPLRLRHVDDLPERISRVADVDFTDRSKWEGALQRLITSMETRDTEDADIPPENRSSEDGESVSRLAITPGSVAPPTIPSSPRLQKLGCKHDPFAYLHAETTPQDLLEYTYVEHPGFQQDVILDFRHSTVLLALSGGGNTVSCYKFESVLKEHHFETSTTETNAASFPSRALIVNYDGLAVGGVTDHVDISDHTRPLLSAVADAIRAHIDRHPDRFRASDDKVQITLWSFLTQYSSFNPALQRWSDPRLDDSYAVFERRGDVETVFQSGVQVHRILTMLVDLIAYLGLDCMYILVDGVEGLHGEDTGMIERLMMPLLNALPLFSIDGVVFKFFLPLKLDDLVVQSRGYSTGRLRKLHIEWNEKRLVKLLNRRLEWASDERIKDFVVLCDQELLAEDIDVAKKLAELALRHRFGPPRAILKLAKLLFEDGEGRLTRDEWEQFLLSQASDLKKYPFT